jgi:chorismate mutase-like protein
MPDLVPLRARIDAVDRQILDLLRQRLELVYQVGEVKRVHAAPIYDPRREGQILDYLSQSAQAPLSAAMARRIFQGIIEEFRAEEAHHVGREAT